MLGLFQQLPCQLLRFEDDLTRTDMHRRDEGNKLLNTGWQILDINIAYM